MDSAAAHLSSPSPSESHGLHAVVTPRLLTVVAQYTLTEAGRKASLLAGGDGRAQQVLELQLPTTRLHLVTVDAQGRARLKLSPRYELGEDQRVVRHNGAARLRRAAVARRPVPRRRPQPRTRAPLPHRTHRPPASSARRGPGLPPHRRRGVLRRPRAARAAAPHPDADPLLRRHRARPGDVRHEQRRRPLTRPAGRSLAALPSRPRAPQGAQPRGTRPAGGAPRREAEGDRRVGEGARLRGPACPACRRPAARGRSHRGADRRGVRLRRRPPALHHGRRRRASRRTCAR